MSIPVVCPNGHALKVKENLAGKSGLCPVCRAIVHVPQAERKELSEDAILGILGSRPTGPGGAGAGARAGVRSAQRQAPPKKSCHKCNTEIMAGTHICPHCHTYIAKLEDF
jgi:hypothetical protein